MFVHMNMIQPIFILIQVPVFFPVGSTSHSGFSISLHYFLSFTSGAEFSSWVFNLFLGIL
jgi:hypothetical protein